jgi:hypothetical protein
MNKEQLISAIAELGADDAADVAAAAVERIGEHGRAAGEPLKQLVARLPASERSLFEEGVAWVNEADAA